MSGSKAQTLFQTLFEPADVLINGSRPWDVQVHTPEFYDRVMSGGSVALGESYMDGWWDCEALDEFFSKILKCRIDDRAKEMLKAYTWDVLKAIFINAQKKARAFVVGKQHYDIGNVLFSKMLDPGLNYSCGYWHSAQTLDDAQNAKCELICRKIGLRPDMLVLDIGCGWGGFAKYAAENYGAEVYGITVSKEQVEYANWSCQGLSCRYALKDYRDLDGQFDRIVSVGMFEHVGYKNYRTYMEVVHRCLKPGGIFLLHTIGTHRSKKTVDPWIAKYIFPNSMLPSAKQITDSAEDFLVLEDWHSFGQYYDKTLLAWYENFTKSWDELKSRYDNRFYRMWTYYLLSCAGGFRAGRNHLWQIVFSKDGIDGVFRNSDAFFV